MRKNGERGMTLVELMAAMLLAGILIALAALVLRQIGAFTTQTTLRELDDMSADGVMRALRTELTQASEVYYLNADELRYRQNIHYYALRFEMQPEGRTITRYKFNAENSEAAADAFDDPDVSFITDSDKYSAPFRIGERLYALQVEVPDTAVSGAEYVPAAERSLVSSGNIRLRLTFNERRSQAGTGTVRMEHGGERHIVVNLMND